MRHESILCNWLIRHDLHLVYSFYLFIVSYCVCLSILPCLFAIRLLAWPGTAGWLHYELFFSHLLLLLSVGVMKKPRIWQSLESEVWFTLQVSLFWGTHAPWIHAGYGLHSNIHRSPFSADNAVWQTDRQRDRIVVAYTVLDACMQCVVL